MNYFCMPCHIPAGSVVALQNGFFTRTPQEFAMIRMRLFSLVLAAMLAPLPFVGQSVYAAPKPATAKQMQEYEATTKAVWDRLLAKANQMYAEKPKNWNRVKLLIVDSIPRPGKDPMYFNAVATYLEDAEGIYPVVYITRDYMEVYQGDEDGIAYVLGHELGHHFLGHIAFEHVYKTQTKADIDQRRKEADADMFGAKLLLRADFSLKLAIKSNFDAMKHKKATYSSAQGSWCDHPGEADRMARIATLVSDHEEQLWRCMSAFENGVYFLTIEDYTAAEACFLRVTQEFPNCAEAWANLGMARLMAYCDKLNAEELRRLDIGQFVAGIRFRYAKMDGLRDNGMKKWQAAEDALMVAYKLKPKSTTILVGLGLAYLVCPERTDKRMLQADDFLARAYTSANSSENDLEPEALAALLINRGVVRIAKGDTDNGQGLIEKAGKIGKELDGADAIEVEQAVKFNTAMAQRAVGKNAQAIATLKSYLLSVPSSSPWWSVAYKAYFDLQMAMGAEPQSQESLTVKASQVRRQMAVKLANGKIVHVGESVKDVKDKLGTPASEMPDSSTGLNILSYPALGVTFITDTQEVVGLTLTGENSPVILVQEKGTNGKVLGEVRIGMTRDEVKTQTGVTDWISRKFTNISDERCYPYSPGLGIALIYGKGKNANVVVGILIGSIKAQGEEVVQR